MEPDTPYIGPHDKPTSAGDARAMASEQARMVGVQADRYEAEAERLQGLIREHRRVAETDLTSMAHADEVVDDLHMPVLRELEARNNRQLWEAV